MHMTVSLKKDTTNEKVSGDVTVDKLHTKIDQYQKILTSILWMFMHIL